jgi:hypothetical protein
MADANIKDRPGVTRLEKSWWRWAPGKRRRKWKLEKCRIEALSSITGDRLSVQLMAQRPRKSDDPLDNALLEKFLNRLAEIEQSAKDATLPDELDDLIADGELQGLFAAYLCPTTEIQDEGNMLIDNLEGWGIPKASTNRLRELFAKKLDKATVSSQEARSALYAIFAEEDAWGDYIDEYEERMQGYMLRLFLITLALLLLAIVALYFAAHFWPLLLFGLIFAGLAGSSVSVMAKMPALDVSLSGELNAYGRRILSRTVVGAVGSLIGCALLGWGFLPIAIQSQTFTDALTACITYPALPGVGLKALIVLGVAMLLGVSERTLTSFEQKVFGNIKTERE